jgi:hypothetical protein
MDDAKAKWNEAGAAMSGLGAKLKAHYDEQADGAGGVRTGQEVGEALARLAEAVRDGFEAVGAAAKDPTVRDDVKQAATALTEALVATVEEAGRDVREAYDRRRRSGS